MQNMYSPDVWDRNLLSLIRSGAFNDKRPIEPMSPYKWRRLVTYMTDEGLADVLSDGAQSHYYDDSLNIPEQLLVGVANKLKASPPQSISECYKVGDMSMNNPKLNARLSAVLKDEYKNKDMTWETLQLLAALVAASHKMMLGEDSLRCITDIGIFVRNEGGKVNYAKLCTCLRAISLWRVANLIGSMLVGAMGFRSDEVPFAGKRYNKGMEHFFKKVVHAPKGISSITWYAWRETRATQNKATSNQEDEIQ